ncbi:MAG TPA: hypothetical protein VNZ52_01490, partial [Candidatus Thermoplasmatota archaeon]|nr:hypothetical protein [Candidatus Thermoplasmatota archaeon]
PSTKPVKGGRRESFMCVTCGALSIYSDWEGDAIKVRCHSCKTEYPDMLKLIPVKEVGPVELLFGPGPMGYVKAGLTVLLPIGVYLIFKLLR